MFGTSLLLLFLFLALSILQEFIHSLDISGESLKSEWPCRLQIHLLCPQFTPPQVQGLLTAPRHKLVVQLLMNRACEHRYRIELNKKVGTVVRMEGNGSSDSDVFLKS